MRILKRGVKMHSGSGGARLLPVSIRRDINFERPTKLPHLLAKNIDCTVHDVGCKGWGDARENEVYTVHVLEFAEG